MHVIKQSINKWSLALAFINIILSLPMEAWVEYIYSDLLV